jgi:hypothetical protein
MITENVDALYYMDQPPLTYNVTPQVLLNDPTKSPIPIDSNAAQLMAAHNCTERGAGFEWIDLSISGSTSQPVKFSAVPPQAAINGAKDSLLAATPTRLPNNWPTAIGQTAKEYAARPSSDHPGGAVFTFAAGNTRFISQDIDYNLVYCRMMVADVQKVWTMYPQNSQKPPNSWMPSYPVDESQF